MEHLPDNFKLVLAGPTITSGEIDNGMTTDQVPKFLNMIECLNLSDRIKVVPNYVDTAEYISGADIFCFPAQNEAMGTPLLEALVSGTPTVANAEEPSFTEWIINGENGFLVDMSTRKWATAIKKLANYDFDKCQKISIAISSKVDSNAIYESYFQLLNNIKDCPADGTVDVEKVLSP